MTNVEFDAKSDRLARVCGPGAASFRVIEVKQVFLDANVLFSASYREENRFLKLWELPGVRCVTSERVLAEAIRNVRDNDHLRRLMALRDKTDVVRDKAEVSLAFDVPLAEKDQHVLRSAVGCEAAYLLTGDKAHFGMYFGRNICGTTVLLPMEFLDRYPRL
jgi:predicted nucleic acid-binding protein